MDTFEFCVTAKFEDIEFDEEQRELLKKPSNLTDVLLISDYWGKKYRLVDFTGTTNEEAIKKILTFYKHKTYRRGVGDHIFFEGFYIKDGKAEIVLGS
jgi:hypothetical protein